MCRKSINKPVVNVGVVDDKSCAHADLALMKKSADYRRTNRMIQTGDIKYHGRTVTAKFKG